MGGHPCGVWLSRSRLLAAPESLMAQETANAVTVVRMLMRLEGTRVTKETKEDGKLLNRRAKTHCKWLKREQKGAAGWP